LYDLRNEKEGHLNRVLSQNSVGVLEDYGIAMISRFKECNCGDRRYRVPEKQVLIVAVS
jgi:hypothetical protein